jgi:hypothetical protein
MSNPFDYLLGDKSSAPAEVNPFDYLLADKPEEEYPDAASRAASRPQVTAPPLADTEDAVSRRADVRKSAEPLTSSLVDAGIGGLQRAGAGALDALWGFAQQSEARKAKAAETGITLAGDPMSTAQDIAAMLLPKDDAGSVKRFESAKQLEDMAEANAPVLQKMGVTQAWKSDQFAPWLLTQAASQTPSYAAMLATILVPELAPATLPMMGITAGGNQYAENRKAGVSIDASGTDATLNGLIEAASEGLTFVGAKIAAPAFKAIVESIPDSMKRTLATSLIARAVAGVGVVAGGGLGEGATEGIGQVGQDLSQKYIAGRDPGDMTENALSATVGAMLPGAGFSAAGMGRAAVGDALQRRSEVSEADAAQTSAESKASEMFGGMRPAAPGQAQPIQPYTGSPTPPVVPALPAPGRTVAEVSAQPLPVTEVPTVDPAQAHADAVEAARAATEASRASANWAPPPAPATQAGAAPQTASQIDISEADPSASIAAIAAAPITQVGASPTYPDGVPQDTHHNSAGDLANTLFEIDALKKAAKTAPKEQRAQLAAKAEELIRGARAMLADYGAKYGSAAAGNLHRTAAETLQTLKGHYASLQKPAVQVPGASTEREQVTGLNIEVPSLDAKAAPVTIPSPIGPAPARQPVAGELPKIEMPGTTPGAVPAASAAEGVQQIAAQQTYPGSVEARGIHYGNTANLTSLLGGRYGTGASMWNGEERGRLQTAPDTVKQRVYFYEHDGIKLPEPEGVVTGTHAYEAKLPGLLDVTTKEAAALMKAVPRDSQGRMDLNAFEQAVHDAGYSGYKHGNQIVTLGRDVPVKYLGTRFEALKAEREASTNAPKNPAETKPAESKQKEAVASEKRVHISQAYAEIAVADAHPSVQRIVTSPLDPDVAAAQGPDVTNLRAPTPKEQRALAGILQGLLNAGMPSQLLDGVTGFHVYTAADPTERAQQYSAGDGRELGITQKVLLKLMAGNAQEKVDALTTIAHEVDHHVSNHWTERTGWTSLPSQSPRMAIAWDPYGKTREPMGDMMSEAVDFYLNPDSDPNLVRYLEYPLGVWDAKVGANQRDNHTRFLQEEVMAQLAGLWYTAPNTMKKELPIAAKYFEDRDNAIRKEPNASLKRVRDIAADGLQIARDGNAAEGSKGAGQKAGAARSVEPGAGDEKLNKSRQPSNRELAEGDRRGVLDFILSTEKKTLNKIESAKNFVSIFLSMPSTKEMAAIAWAGKAKKGWYRSASYALHHVFGLDAPRFAVLLAAMSPQTSVEDNLRGALQTWVLWQKAGRPVAHAAIEKLMKEGIRGTGVIGDTDRNNVIRALTHPDPAGMLISGPKINSFYRNLIDDVNEVTNDSWMAAFAGVDAAIFGGLTTPLTKNGGIVTNPGKGAGYLAMSAHVRQAAAMLTKRTGEVWTPAEVQETIWSWAKTLYEMGGKNRTAESILNNKELTDALIAATPDFGSLFTVGEYANILRNGGLAAGVENLAAARRTSAENEGRNPHPSSAGQKAPFTSGVQSVFESRAARRLDAVRKSRAEESARAAAAKAEKALAFAAELGVMKDQEKYEADDPINANPLDFRESPEEAIKKDGWAFITATVEDRAASYNTVANKELLKDLKALGFGFEAVQGMWRGVYQGNSYIVYAPTSISLKLAEKYHQEAITTSQGFEYVDGRLERADHSKDVVGEEATKLPGYTILPDGTPISIGFMPAQKNANKSTGIAADADRIAAIPEAKRDDIEFGNLPGGYPAHNLFEARKLLPKPSEKLKKITERNSYTLYDEYHYIANVDGKHYGISEYEDPDNAEDADEDTSGKVFAYTPLEAPSLRMTETQTHDPAELFAEIRAGYGNKSASTESLAGDGREHTAFFSAASRGERAPDAKVPYVPTLDISSNAGFTAEYLKHRGNFDDHIATSIPGFREVQQAVGDAIVRSYPEGAQLLDIAASEGAFNKAISATSEGRIETLALDPNLTMAKHFKDISTVPGATYDVSAFGSAEDAGKEAWTEDDGTKILTFDPKIKYDVIHESMGFQFISNTRDPQFARVKEMMQPDGIALFEEKVIGNTEEWKAREKKKDRYKARYYTPDQLAAKKAEVLEKGQAAADKAESAREEQIVGMHSSMLTEPQTEVALKKHWKYVSQYWDSGNFKGYVAGDSQASVQRFLSNLTDLNSEYSNVETPVAIGAPMNDLTVPVKVEVTESETGRTAEVTMPADEALKALDGDIEQTRKLLLCLSA